MQDDSVDDGRRKVTSGERERENENERSVHCPTRAVRYHRR